METMSKYRVTIAILAAIATLVFGLMLFLLFIWLDQDQGLGGAAFVALLIAPFLVFGVGSGLIQEFSGPGGWGAKFNAIATEKVTIPGNLGGAEADFELLEVVKKGSLAALQRLRIRLNQGQSIALTLKLGGTYIPTPLLSYLRVLMSFDPRLSVIIIHSDGRFAGSTLGSKLMSLLGELDAKNENQQTGPKKQQFQALISALKKGDMQAVGDVVSISLKSLTVGNSNAEALSAMLKEDSPSIVVIDDQKRPVGLVRRDDIVAKMLVRLAA